MDRGRGPAAESAVESIRQLATSVPLVASLDSDVSGRLAAEHLLGLGLEHFAYCGVRGPVASKERRNCFAAHLAARGHKLHSYAQRVGEGESRIEPLIRWLQELPKPVGVLTSDDKLGERVLTACRWGDLPVPGRVAVLGIGNDELMCEVSWPSLSASVTRSTGLGFWPPGDADQAICGSRSQTAATDPQRGRGSRVDRHAGRRRHDGPSAPSVPPPAACREPIGITRRPGTGRFAADARSAVLPTGRASVHES